MRTFHTTVTVLTATVLLAACGSSSQSNSSSGAQGAVSTPTTTGPLTTAAAVKPLSSLTWWIWYRPLASIDPVKYNDYPENLIIPNMCESLTRQTPGMATVPDLARSWSRPHPNTIVFNLHHGVKFWDGSAMTSADVVYSLERNLDPKTASIYGFSFANVKSITASGPYRVVVTFKAPDVTFIPEMASLGGAVVEQKFTKAAGSNFGTPQGKVMCTGPYKLQSWDGTSSLVMVRNPHYWNPALTPKTNQISFVWPQDPGQVASAFATGSFAGGFDILSSDITSLKASGAGKLYINPSSRAIEIEALAVIGTKGPIASPLVRRALSLSINRAAVIKVGQAGVGQPAYALAGGGYWSYERSAYQSAYNGFVAGGENLALAKKLVAQAGAVAKQPIVLAVQGSSPDAANQAQIIQQGAQSVGLNLKLRIVSNDQYGALFSDPKSRVGFDLMQTTNYDQDPDPVALYDDVALPNATSNFNNYNNPQVVRLLTQARAATNPAARARLVISAQKLIMADLPWIPLSFIPGAAFVRHGVCGVTLDFSQMTSPWAASVGGC